MGRVAKLGLPLVVLMALVMVLFSPLNSWAARDAAIIETVGTPDLSNYSVSPGDADKDIDHFDVTTNGTGGACQITALTVTSSNTSKISQIKLKSADGLTTYATNNSPTGDTWAFSSLTLGAAGYRLDVDIQGSASGGNITAYVTSLDATTCTGANLGSTDTAGTTISICDKTIDNCVECHLTPPIDGARSAAGRSVVGSHQAHDAIGAQCYNCHVDPGSDLKHRNGYINMNATSVSYSKGSTFLQVTSPTLGTCTNASCHDNGTGALLATPTWGTVVNDCSECHPTQPTTGSHTAHLGPGGANCGNCHDSVIQGSTAIAGQHLDGNIDVYDVTFGDLGYPSNKAKNSAYTTCNNASCHDNGRGTKVTTPTWGTSITDCSECHPKQPTTGSHQKHLGTGAVCGNCHDSAVEGSTAIAGQHLDNNIDVYDTSFGDLGYPSNKAKNSAYTTCNNAYCHDDGTGSKVTTPTWGTTGGGGCNACHQAAPSTGSHTAHLSFSDITIACGNCHDSAVEGSTAIAGQHTDGNIDVYDVTFGDLGYPSNKAKNSAYTTCNNAWCHENGRLTKVTSPTWGTSPAQCSECHPVQPTTGSHTAHLGFSGGISIACGNCHDSAVQGSNAIAGQHLDNNVDVYDVANGDLGYPANKAKNTAFATCNNAYCHDNGRTGKVTTPTWGTAVNDCSECHQTQPSTGSHTKHLSSGANCGNCHDSAQQGSVYPTQHLDGNIDVYDVANGDLGYPANKTKNTAFATCNNASCHDNGTGTKVTTPTWGTSGGCGACHQTVPTTGSHTAHLGNTEISVACGNCHDSVIQGSSAIAGQHTDGNIDVYDVTFGDLGYPTNKAKNSAYTTCNNAWCHDNGRTGKVTTPTWGQTSACNECHLAAPTTGSHSAHLGNTEISIACGNCHDSAVQGVTAIAGQHMDSNVDVYDVSSGDLGYTPNKTKNTAFRTCNNAYCHENGRLAKVTTPTWGQTSACNECHLAAPTTGSHTAHLGFSGGISIACGNCHDSAVQGSNAIAGQHLDGNVDVYDVSSGDLGYTPNKTKNTAFRTCNNAYCHENGRLTKVTTPTWGQTSACNECHLTQPTTGSHSKHLNSGASCNNCHDSAQQGSVYPAQHLDGNIDVYDVANGDLGYPANKTKNTAFATCNNASCHDNGTGTKVTTPTWGTAGGCGACHLVQPTSGSHTKHLNSADISVACGNCHDSAVEGSTAIAGQHTDGNIDVYDVTFGDLGYPQNKTKNTAFATCNNAYCHDNGRGAKVTTPTWGQTSACNECHAAAPTTGSHTAHLGFSGGINIVCGNCHDSAVQGSTAIAGQHIDNNIDVYDVASGDLGYPANKTKNTAFATCNNAYCHENGRLTKVTTPTWGNTVNDCSECHLKQPTTGSHTKHLSGGAVCGNCHDSVVEGSFAIVGQHLDNNIDVYDVASGDLGYPANKAKNSAFATCNNASCHDNGTGTKVTSPTWGSSVANCSACHPTVPTTGSHQKHLNSSEISISCGNCHDSAVQGSSAIAGQHTDGNIDVYDVASGDLGYPSNKTKNTAYATCNNAYCHDNGKGAKVTTPTWGQTSACNECHAQAPATGSHTAHLAYTANVGCGSCHDSAVQGVTAISGQHMDGNIDVYDVAFGDLGYPQNKAKNSAYSSCTNINCHGTQSPTWNTAITRNVCTNCHGDPAAGSTVSDYQIAPYNDTAGNSSATDPQVGAHQMHLTAAAGISNVNGMGCNTCHTKPSSVFQAGHIDSALPAELTFGSLATAGGAAPSYAGSTCTNTYCHNGKYFKNGWSGGLSNTPAWNDTAYLVGTSADCDNCHGYPPGGSHSASTDCSGCHPHVDAGDASFTGVANRAKHVNGLVEAQTNCDSCHGWPPRTGDGKATINGTGGKGAHWNSVINGAHIDNGTLPDPTTADYSAGVAQCKRCHPMSDSSHPENDGAADIGFGLVNSFDGGAPSYGGVPGENPNTTPKTCTNINCHFGKPTPRWSCPSDTE